MNTSLIDPLPGRILHAGWILVGLVWFAAATRIKPTRHAAQLRQMWRSNLLLAAGVVLIAYSPAWPVSGIMLLRPSDPAAWAGLGVMVPGLALALWARLRIGRNWSARAVVKDQHELITHGPYHYVRHPIYTGLLAMALGTVLQCCTIGTAVGWLAVLAGVVLQARQEEHLMRATFGETYDRYASRVAGLMPRII